VEFIPSVIQDMGRNGNKEMAISSSLAERILIFMAAARFSA